MCRLSVDPVFVNGPLGLVKVVSLPLHLGEHLPEGRLVGDLDRFLSEIERGLALNVDGGMPKEEERATIATRSSSVILTFICAVLLLPRIA